jgi:hypothetical protein
MLTKKKQCPFANYERNGPDDSFGFLGSLFR